MSSLIHPFYQLMRTNIVPLHNNHGLVLFAVCTKGQYYLLDILPDIVTKYIFYNHQYAICLPWPQTTFGLFCFHGHTQGSI